MDLPDDSSPYRNRQPSSKPPITLPGGRSGLDDAFSHLIDPDNSGVGGRGGGGGEGGKTDHPSKPSSNTQSPPFSDSEEDEDSFDPDDLLKLTDEAMSRTPIKSQT